MGFTLAALASAGCHKKTAVYVPPAPPLIASTAQVPVEPKLGVAEALRKPVAPPPATNRKPDVVEVGLASWYGPPYHNHPGADGTIFDKNAMTAAHKTLPLGSVARVTNLSNNQSVEVRITDRGPFVGERLIDLSLAAAKATGVYRAGVARVRVEAFLPAPKPGINPGGRWCAQIGAFLTVEDAVVLKNELRQRYPAAKVIEFQGPTGFWVRINPNVADRAHAAAIVAGIHVPEAEAFLVRTD